MRREDSAAEVFRKEPSPDSTLGGVSPNQAALRMSDVGPLVEWYHRLTGLLEFLIPAGTEPRPLRTWLNVRD